jgi:hypothetical protein
MHKHTTTNTHNECRNHITVTTSTEGTITRAGMPARVATQQQGNKKKRQKAATAVALATERMPLCQQQQNDANKSTDVSNARKFTQKMLNWLITEVKTPVHICTNITTKNI